MAVSLQSFEGTPCLFESSPSQIHIYKILKQGTVHKTWYYQHQLDVVLIVCGSPWPGREDWYYSALGRIRSRCMGQCKDYGWLEVVTSRNPVTRDLNYLWVSLHCAPTFSTLSHAGATFRKCSGDCITPRTIICCLVLNASRKCSIQFTFNIVYFCFNPGKTF